MEAMLTPREQRILKAIVHVYITSVEPVASRTISRGHPMALSPATIRHVMGRLEELGTCRNRTPRQVASPPIRGIAFTLTAYGKFRTFPKNRSRESMKAITRGQRAMLGISWR